MRKQVRAGVAGGASGLRTTPADPARTLPE